MKYLLGIDVGTTSVKAILIGQDGSVVGKAQKQYPTFTPQPGYSEQNPEDWWNSVCFCANQVTNDVNIRANIAAISLSTQGGTVAGFDENGNAVRPAIVWNDRRCTEELRELKRDLRSLDVYRVCGWHADLSMPALISRWIKKNEPEKHKKIKRFLSVPDYLSLKFTGKAVTDISSAGICRFTDIMTGSYDPRLSEFAGLSNDQLPGIIASGIPIGTLTCTAARELNLPDNVLFVSGAHDQYAAALGAGAVNCGDILIGTGTSWVVTGLAKDPSFEEGLSQSVSAVPGLWGGLSSLPSGGICLEWLRKNVSSGQTVQYETIDKEVALRTAASQGLFFFPFSGCCDKKKRFNKGSFTGLDLSHDKFHLARAVMEGVAFQMRMIIEKFSFNNAANGIILTGGAAKSEIWTQMAADISGLSVKVPLNPDTACTGAAILAGTGAGIFTDVQTGCELLCGETRHIMPDKNLSEKYEKYYSEYISTAKALGAAYKL